MGMLESVSSGEDILIKGTMFVLVQALVYLILSNSSNVFSNNKMLRSLSFKPARSVSIRSMFAAISDMPPGDESSPRGFPFPSPTKEFSRADDLVFS